MNLNGQASLWSTSGLVLSPILFNMHVSDMPSIVNNPIFQFANDLRTIRSVDYLYKLQHDVNILFDWS